MFCDSVAIHLHAARRLRFAREHKENPRLTISKLVFPLVLLRIMEYLEACGSAEKQQKKISIIKGEDMRAGYPSFRKRITSVFGALVQILETSVGGRAGENVTIFWRELDRQTGEAMANATPKVEERILQKHGGLDMIAIKDLLRKNMISERNRGHLPNSN